jgi:hypothetical protein
MQETGTTFWHDAVEKEMKGIHKAMQVFEGDITEAMKRLIGYQQINCHMAFDIKMEGLCRDQGKYLDRLSCRHFKRLVYHGG